MTNQNKLSTKFIKNEIVTYLKTNKVFDQLTHKEETNFFYWKRSTKQKIKKTLEDWCSSNISDIINSDIVIHKQIFYNNESEITDLSIERFFYNSGVSECSISVISDETDTKIQAILFMES